MDWTAVISEIDGVVMGTFQESTLASWQRVAADPIEVAIIRELRGRDETGQLPQYETITMLPGVLPGLPAAGDLFVIGGTVYSVIAPAEQPRANGLIHVRLGKGAGQ